MKDRMKLLLMSHKENVWDNEEGGMAETVIIIAIFAAAAIFITRALTGAIKDKANEASDIISGADFNG